MYRGASPVPNTLSRQKVRQGCSLGTIKGSVAAAWEFLDCNFLCMFQVLYWTLPLKSCFHWQKWSFEIALMFCIYFNLILFKYAWTFYTWKDEYGWYSSFCWIFVMLWCIPCPYRNREVSFVSIFTQSVSFYELYKKW